MAGSGVYRPPEPAPSVEPVTSAVSPLSFPSQVSVCRASPVRWKDPNRATSAIRACLGTRRRVQIALRLRAFGGPENFDLTDVPKPAIRPGMALIRVDATSVNQIDVRIRSGQVPIGPDFPTILGADEGGTIEEVGAGVLDFAPGDEVHGCAGAPHGLPITHQQQLNADLLVFIKS